MDLELTDKVAVVTGASKGIGLAVVRELAAEGAIVVAGARRVETLEHIEGVTPMAVDLADPDGPQRLVDYAVDELGRVDVLVNNVGAAHVRLDGFLTLTDDDFEASLQLNFFAALRATRAAVKDMVKRQEGAIVNVGSVNSFFEPDGGVIDYGAAKAALINLAKSLSQELGPSGIRVTSVSPGPVATDLWLGDDGVAENVGRATGEGADAVREQMARSMPTGRFTGPREVATIVALLASPRMANVTGGELGHRWWPGEDNLATWRSEDGNWVWTFVLEEHDGRTRLISRNRFRLPTLAARVGTLPIEPGSLVLGRKMLRGIKQRAERLTSATPEQSGG